MEQGVEGWCVTGRSGGGFLEWSEGMTCTFREEAHGLFVLIE